MVLCGHDHVYERSFPTFDSRRDENAPYLFTIGVCRHAAGRSPPFTSFCHKPFPGQQMPPKDRILVAPIFPPGAAAKSVSCLANVARSQAPGATTFRSGGMTDPRQLHFVSQNPDTRGSMFTVGRNGTACLMILCLMWGASAQTCPVPTNKHTRAPARVQTHTHRARAHAHTRAYLQRASRGSGLISSLLPCTWSPTASRGASSAAPTAPPRSLLGPRGTSTSPPPWLIASQWCPALQTVMLGCVKGPTVHPMHDSTVDRDQARQRCS